MAQVRVIEKVKRVVPVKQVKPQGVYEYGMVSILLSKELVGKKVKVIVYPVE